MPAENWDDIRPYVINITEGKLSTTGSFKMTINSLSQIFDEHLPEYMKECEKNKITPRLMFFAHGGLVSENVALGITRHHSTWWRKNGVYPLYFVWETGPFETIFSMLGERQPDGMKFGFKEKLEELKDAIRDAAQDVADSASQFLARKLGGPAIWGQMKDWPPASIQANFASDQVVRRLATFLKDHPTIELHAAGHSAGAIFHAYFLPHALAAIAESGGKTFKSLHLLAPAITVADFENLLGPKLGGGIDFTRIYTMNDRAEKDDNCAHLYLKSLLYLIYYSLEPETETPLLGLERSLSDNERSDLLRRTFRLDGARSELGQVLFTPHKNKLPDQRQLENRTGSTTHGGFDDDPSTMNSIAHFLLNAPPKVPFTQADSKLREQPVYALYTRESLAISMGDELEGGTPQGMSFGGGAVTITPAEAVNARAVRLAVLDLVESVLEG